MPIVILADDHELIREAVKPYLQMLCDGATVWEASSYDEVLNLVRRASETAESVLLALLDLHMPAGNASDHFDALGQVCQALPDTAVVVFSSDEDGQTIAKALSSGARGYITKSSRSRTLLNALTMVLQGETFVPLAIVNNASDPASNADSKPAPGENDVVARLSPREIASLRLLMQGMTNKEIGRELGLQDVTIKMHLRNAYRKIGASNRIEAVRIAVERRL